MRQFFRRSLALAVTALPLIGDPTFAAEGYFLSGYGARQKALSGADAADSRDAMSLSVNPAGLVAIERQLQIGMTALMPERGYSTTGNPLVVAPGDARSGRPLFPAPNGGYAAPIDETSAWGLALYANGGINAAYDWGHFRRPFGGPFGGGFAGVDLEQTFASLGYAKRWDELSIGVAPTLAIQMINIQGLNQFSVYSADITRLTDHAYDWSVGGGVRVGAQWNATEQLRFAVAGASPMFMTPFDKYAGLLADRGSFDIPANVTAGLAYDVLPELTLMADWKRIFFSSVPATGNPSFPILRSTLGLPNGPGFDWKDTDAFAFGAEWRATSDLALRAGYVHSANPVRAQAATLNILSPIIAAHHASAGLSYKVTSNSSLDFAVMYGFKNSLTGPELLPQTPLFPFGAYNPTANVTIWLRGVEASLQWTYRFDATDNSILPTHL